MSRRAKDLLGEMQGIFGTSFGSEEGEDLDERRALHGGRPRPQQDRTSKKQRAKEARRGKKDKPHKGLLGKGQGKDYWVQRKRGEEQYAKSKKDIKKEVGRREQELKTKEGEARYKSAMKDIHGKMDKSKKEYDDRQKAKAKGKGKGGGREAVSAGGEGSRSEKKQAGRSLSQKSARRHFPFKRSSDLGPGPRGRKHKETKCWKCKCGNVYRDGCHCVASGSGPNCPKKGTTKTISYTPSYKQAYNREYHSWRAKQGARATQKLGATRTAL